MNIEAEILKIQERNRRVEADKAWETSLARKVLVAIGTYFVVVLVMLTLELDRPMIGAIIPTLGFLLSTLGLNFFKNLWIRHHQAGAKSQCCCAGTKSAVCKCSDGCGCDTDCTCKENA